MDEFIWSEKYRPRTVEETILPKQLKRTFQNFVQQGDIPNLLLVGPPGCGKTTVAQAMLHELGADYIMIDGSRDGGINTLRTDIQNFASTVSFSGGRKFVILDEADYTNPQSTQPALRGFMQQYSKNCGFIFTGNFLNKIIEPLWSRTSVIEFVIPKEERMALAGELFKRVQTILEQEGVEYDKGAVGALVKKHFPDFRRIINELQRYSADGAGTIDAGILVDHKTPMQELITTLPSKDFKTARGWIAQNSDIPAATFYRSLYDMLPEKITSETSRAEMIMILAEYQYKEAFVADSEINRAAAVAELMRTVQW